VLVLACSGAFDGLALSMVEYVTYLKTTFLTNRLPLEAMKGALHIQTSKRRIHDLDADDRLCILPEWSHHVRPPQSVSPAGLGCSQEQCYQFVAVVARPQLCTLVTCGSKGTGVIREGMCKHLILLFTGRNDAGGQETLLDILRRQ
jgi:hypothetical protein